MVNQSRPMHNKAEVHQDKLKEMHKRHNIMVDREFNIYCTVSYGPRNSHRHSFSFKFTADSQTQASFPPLLLRTMTQPTATGDRDRARKVVDTNNLEEQDLKNLKKYDRFLYYSIPTVVRDAIRAKAKVGSNEEIQVQVQVPLQDGNGSKSSIESKSTATATSTMAMVERKTRISYECHPDLLLESLLDDDPDYSIEQEHEDCVVDVDPILHFMDNTTRRQRQ